MIDLNDAINSNSEKSDLDFKREFNPADKKSRVEIVKDIVAIANSGGGFIFIGVDNDGTPYSEKEYIDEFENEDITKLENDIKKYIGIPGIPKIDKFPHEKDGAKIIVLKIYPSEYPIVFSMPGGFDEQNSSGKTTHKNAFQQGTVYFRQGTQSSPCHYNDLRKFIDEKVKKSMSRIPDNLAKFNLGIEQCGRSSSGRERTFNFKIKNLGGTINRGSLYWKNGNSDEFNKIEKLDADLCRLKIGGTVNFSIKYNEGTNFDPIIEFKITGLNENGDEDSICNLMTLTKDGYKSF